MKRVEKIFGSEREAKVALVLLRTLQSQSEPIKFTELLRISLDEIIRVEETHPASTHPDYKQILEELQRESYLRIGKYSTLRYLIDAFDELQLTEEGQRFIEENYPLAT